MSRHPITPMNEADLRRHLAAQGLAQVAGIDYPDYEQDDAALDRQLAGLLARKPDAVLLDVAHAGHLATVGRLIWQHAQQQNLLAAGPSSVVQALAAHWQAGAEAAPPRVNAASGPVLVLAGSLSPVTARQVQAASSYRQVALDAARLAGDAAYAQQMSAQVAALLAQGRHVLACTSADGHASDWPVDGRALAQASGALLARVLDAVPLRRLGIAGGDTSSLAVQALKAWGLSYAAPLAPGVALCRLHSDEAALDGLEIMLKGGQMGGEDLFETLLHGNA